MRRRLLAGLLLCVSAAFAQDERRIASPDGQVEFRLFLGQPEPGALSRLAYQVWWRGKRVVDTSFLGLNIYNQEPLLGENTGLIGSHASEGAGYRALTAEYMQNGSLGRRLNIEVRVANDGVAFRYVLPRTPPLQELLIEDEVTEFALPGPAPERVSLPYTSGGFTIAEAPAEKYPRALLIRSDGALVTRLQSDSHIAFEGTTPWTGPWRLVVLGARLEGSSILRILRQAGLTIEDLKK